MAPPTQKQRFEPVPDKEQELRREFVAAEVRRHTRIRVIGLLTVLSLLVVVYPLLTFFDARAIGGWRKTILPGSERAILPSGPISHVEIESATRRLTLKGVGITAQVPILAPAISPPAGTSRILTWGPGEMSLVRPFPCLERGTAGVLRALGRPSLYAANAGRCVRLDSATYDLIFTHASSDTLVAFR
jgi:hypothetical protein